jgi:hypothetical protein
MLPVTKTMFLVALLPEEKAGVGFVTSRNAEGVLTASVGEQCICAWKPDGKLHLPQFSAPSDLLCDSSSHA